MRLSPIIAIRKFTLLNLFNYVEHLALHYNKHDKNLFLQVSIPQYRLAILCCATQQNSYTSEFVYLGELPL